MFLARLLTFLEDGAAGGDADIIQFWDKIEGIVNDTVMPLIYAALGLFLVVKGAILGMQIVKAADEPQVRQEKIGSLKWLIIGVAVAFGVAAVAQIVVNYFADQAGQKTLGDGGSDASSFLLK
jgi:hypothetical protein